MHLDAVDTVFDVFVYDVNQTRPSTDMLRVARQSHEFLSYHTFAIDL